MIDETLLTDPTRCPDCGTTLSAARDVCPDCGLPLTGPVAGRLWQVSVQAAETLRTRAGLVTALREQAMSAAPVGASPAPATSSSAAAAGFVPPVAARPRPEWSARRVQNLLLALGVALLGVAAVIFVAVSWERLGVGGRSAVMAGVTALAAAGAVGVHRRGLLSTAEWLSVLTVGLTVLDCYGARSADLAGLASVEGAVFWAAALAAVAVGAGLFAVLLPTRVLPLAAALAAQLPLPLLAGHLVDDVSHPAALVAALLAVQAVAGLGAAGAWPAGTRTHDARAVVGAGGGLAHLAATLAALVAAYAEAGSLVVGTALLLALAAVPALAGTVLARREPEGDGRVAACDVTAALLLVAATWAPLADRVPDRWLGPVLAVPVLLLLAVLPLVPRARRVAPGGLLLIAGLVPALSALGTVGGAVDRMLVVLRVPETAWSVSTRAAAVPADWSDVLALAATGAALLLGARVLRAAPLRVAALPVLATAGWLVAPAASATFPVQLGVLLGLAALLLAAGAQLDVRGWVWLGGTALGCGAVATTAAVAWSFSTPTATLVTLPAAAAALAVATVAARGAEQLRVWRVLLVLAALLLALTEAGAVARHDGAGWPAVWSLVLVLGTGVAVGVALLLSLRTAAADPFWAPLHTSAVVVAAAAAAAAAAAIADWRGAALADIGLVAATSAALLTLGSCAPLATPRPVRGAVQVVAIVVAAPALLLAALDAERLWVALLVVGATVAVVALTSVRPVLGWVAGLLLAASSWVRLALSDVDAPEAYTVPAAAALLALGLLRRRRDPAYGSWHAYGSGLSLALLPSLLRALTDSGDLRPLLLALAAAAVVGLGVRQRLQAPLVMGAAVLAVDALVQLAPYLVEAYQVVPRWITIGSIGLLLLVAGATYERRVRDLRRVGRHVARLG